MGGNKGSILTLQGWGGKAQPGSHTTSFRLAPLRRATVGMPAHWVQAVKVQGHSVLQYFRFCDVSNFCTYMYIISIIMSILNVQICVWGSFCLILSTRSEHMLLTSQKRICIASPYSCQRHGPFNINLFQYALGLCVSKNVVI